MNEYRVMIEFCDGQREEILIYAVNRIMVFEMLEDMKICDCTNVGIYRITI